MKPDRSASQQPASQGLTVRTGGDGSFSLWSQAFGEGFHSGRGALREARETFLTPSQLERFPTGCTIRVLEVCVGTGCNLAVLLEACTTLGLHLEWSGLELDHEPLALALGEPAFRRAWQPHTLDILQELEHQGHWRSDATQEPDKDGEAGETPTEAAPAADSFRRLTGRARIHWGDARQTLHQVGGDGAARFDLIWHDAFSPQRCPQLWTLEFLNRLARLLAPDGRLITYCSAAALRGALQQSGLQLAALHAPRQTPSARRISWSGGSVASHSTLPQDPLWRPLTPMEREHLASSAGEPYRDPTGRASTPVILAERQRSQAEAVAEGRREAGRLWRQRWSAGHRPWTTAVAGSPHGSTTHPR